MNSSRMNAAQLYQAQALTHLTARNFTGASFRNATAISARTIVIDVYTDDGLAYLGAYTIYVDGRFACYPVSP